jgi:hypothetical protein
MDQWVPAFAGTAAFLGSLRSPRKASWLRGRSRANPSLGSDFPVMQGKNREFSTE